ncbi:peptidase S8/S53 domain-containing protein [Talaromyces proteolyticus]|uniref:Peptidase S8/S53 domain-containing protein n=1 Tax=Talaromyces proteolyticus TaxID=1131652 RepID=A0AAD4KEX8_9EURO|nr:peptidase S8/S53 domain-containing protein [Talaromyces proteolyticus]KAH8689320.1 peptidase S8/S53 domain-containing protein [Talaromyces proteolyticus]
MLEVHEKRSISSTQLFDMNPIPKDSMLQLRIGLTQSNLDRGYDYLIDVADPSSKNYSKHWTVDQVVARFAPNRESVDLTMEWLTETGITDVRQSSNKGWILLNAPVFQIENLLNTKFHEYSSADGVVRIGCEEYSLPQHLRQHVDYIFPGVKLSPPIKRSGTRKRACFGRKSPSNVAIVLNTSSSTEHCGTSITPPCWRALYDIPEQGNVSIPDYTMGVFEYGDTYAQEDLDEYFAAYAPYVPTGTHPKLVSVDGAQAPVPTSSDENDGESDLDFSVVYSLLGAINVTLFQTADTNATLLDSLLDAIEGPYCAEQELEAGFHCGVASLPSVLSISYDTPELFDETFLSQKRACNEFMKLGLQGHTIIVSSGDYGVASNPSFGSSGPCPNGCIPQGLNNTGEHSFHGTIFSPSFPTNCPYVLSVGGTQLSPGQTVKDPETVMNTDRFIIDNCSSPFFFASGGGFANYFPRPPYQNAAVSTYLTKYAPSHPYYYSNYIDVQDRTTTIGHNGGVYNRGGRGIPDVSANGAHMLGYFGELNEADGTSISAPIWASIVALINAERTAHGKSNVGFIQPTLYQNPQMFHDITTGGNPGCNSTGFPASVGWDPSTGLGTPNYPAMLELFLGLP